MELRNWILREGVVVGSEFLRVDGFLNHRIAPAFIERVGEQLADEFVDKNVTCVLTAEAAGNVVAYEVAHKLGIRALYAKKGRARTMKSPIVRTISSPTKGTDVDIAVSREYLGPDDHVLIVDDFLYQGQTSSALAQIIHETGATLVGFGFVIEKVFAQGRQQLACFEVPVVALVSIESMDPETGEISFANPNPLPS